MKAQLYWKRNCSNGCRSGKIPLLKPGIAYGLKLTDMFSHLYVNCRQYWKFCVNTWSILIGWSIWLTKEIPSHITWCLVGWHVREMLITYRILPNNGACLNECARDFWLQLAISQKLFNRSESYFQDMKSRYVGVQPATFIQIRQG